MRFLAVEIAPMAAVRALRALSGAIRGVLGWGFWLAPSETRLVGQKPQPRAQKPQPRLAPRLGFLGSRLGFLANSAGFLLDVTPKPFFRLLSHIDEI